MCVVIIVAIVMMVISLNIHYLPSVCVVTTVGMVTLLRDISLCGMVCDYVCLLI